MPRVAKTRVLGARSLPPASLIDSAAIKVGSDTIKVGSGTIFTGSEATFTGSEANFIGSEANFTGSEANFISSGTIRAGSEAQSIKRLTQRERFVLRQGQTYFRPIIGRLSTVA